MILDKILVPHLLIGGSGVAALIQAIPVPTDIGVVNQFKELGFLGWLALIIVVLYKKLDCQEKLMWDKLEAKEGVISALQLAMTASMTANTSAMEKLENTVDNLNTTVEHLVTVRETLIDIERHKH